MAGDKGWGQTELNKSMAGDKGVQPELNKGMAGDIVIYSELNMRFFNKAEDKQ